MTEFERGRAAGMASARSLEIVLIETPTTRDTERIDEPSTSMLRIWVRVAFGSLFMPLN